MAGTSTTVGGVVEQRGLKSQINRVVSALPLSQLPLFSANGCTFGSRGDLTRD